MKSNFLESTRRLDGQFTRLDDAGTGDQEKRVLQANFKPTQLHCRSPQPDGAGRQEHAIKQARISPDEYTADAQNSIARHQAAIAVFERSTCSANEASTKALNKGWLARGEDVNSGWNWQPTNQG